MKIHEVLNPTSGLFSHMPQDIWGTALDPSLLDIELFTAIGSMTASPLFTHYVRDGVLDHDGLARLIHQHYGKNWKRLWDALGRVQHHDHHVERREAYVHARS